MPGLSFPRKRLWPAPMAMVVALPLLSLGGQQSEAESENAAHLEEHLAEFYETQE